jgi:hypothetical protein
MVQACQVKALEPVGVARIDKMLNEESSTGFFTGNASTNLQCSIITPAWSQIEVNGFTELDGVKIEAGDLLKRSLKPILEASHNDPVVHEIKDLLTARPRTINDHEATTLVRVHHSLFVQHAQSTFNLASQKVIIYKSSRLKYTFRIQDIVRNYDRIDTIWAASPLFPVSAAVQGWCVLHRHRPGRGQALPATRRRQRR